MQRMPILSESDMSLFELKTRYVRNYLTFAGKNSKDYLLYISGPGVYDSPAVDVELQAIPGKNGDLIRDNSKAGEHWYAGLLQHALLKCRRISSRNVPGHRDRNDHEYSRPSVHIAPMESVCVLPYKHK